MNSLAIYFGPKVISIVETRGRKLINSIQIPQSTISSGELEEKVPAEVKAIEIIALFKDELRRNNIEAREASLCLSGKDLIIRTFELPLLPREELRSAINFEVKKYIPFKVEELISDFHVEFDKTSRTNFVLFVGIKKEMLERYVFILSQLDIKTVAIEYSAFSILRWLKLAGVNDNGVIGVIGADLSGEDEVNFVVLENGFPMFSRDIALAGAPAGPLEPGKGAEAESARALEKLKTEIRVSLDYYHRKFSTKNIQKIFFIVNPEDRSELEAFIMELGLSAKFIDAVRFIGKSVPYSLNFIKAYSAALSRTIKSKLKVDLLAAKARPQEKQALQEGGFSLLEGLRPDYRVVGLGLLICIAAFVFGFYSRMTLSKQLETIIEVRAKVSTVNPAATYDELTSKDAEFKKKFSNLDNLVKKQLRLTLPLDLMPRVTPKGVWLTNFSFDKKEEGRAELTLEGMAYLADGDKEFGAFNRFLASLKEDANFTNYFKEINITSLDHRPLEKVTVTSFAILCKNYKERE